VNLTKEQKQYLLLGGGVLVILFLVFFFGFKATFASARIASQKVDDLSGRIELAKHSLEERAKMAEERGMIAVKLEELLQNLPPKRNYYSWASEIIYDTARHTALEVDAIDELKRPHLQSRSKKGSSKKKKANKIQIEFYALKITAHGTYEDLKRFLFRVEEKHPLVHVMQLTISPGADVETHDIQIQIQWPFNLDPVKRAWDALSLENKSEEELGRKGGQG
jgi:hypothetical protein